MLLVILSVFLNKKYKGKNSAKGHEVNSDLPELASGQIHEIPQLEAYERYIELPSPLE